MGNGRRKLRVENTNYTLIVYTDEVASCLAMTAALNVIALLRFLSIMLNLSYLIDFPSYIILHTSSIHLYFVKPKGFGNSYSFFCALQSATFVKGIVLQV